MSARKSKTGIINETVAWYSADVSRRSVVLTANGTKCFYVSPGGNLCPFARCVIDPSILKEGSVPDHCYFFGDVIAVNYQSIAVPIDQILKPEYRMHGYEFWETLQQLHDDDRNWESNGLSIEGLSFVHHLLNLYERKGFQHAPTSAANDSSSSGITPNSAGALPNS